MRAFQPVWYLLIAGQALCLAVSLYQTAITLVGTIARARRQEGTLPDPLPRFALLVCARNEAGVIGRLVRDLRAQDYPADRFGVFVVAHNCSDETADIARKYGADVLDLVGSKPGKGVALTAGFRHVGLDWDFVGVFDADSRVDPTFLQKVAVASVGETCLQVESVPKPTRGWVGHGYGLNRRARNVFWWRPREALGLGTTINGSGYFIEPRLARELVHEMRTITEELEVTARLYTRGHCIKYVSTTQVRLEEPEKLKPAVKQRTRWARGHFGTMRYAWPALAKRGLSGDVRAFDIALHMLIPTRVITRTGVTFSMLILLLRLPFALPLSWVMVAMAGEWAVPAGIAFRERLVPRSRKGLILATRQALIGLLWFPIGLWALFTTRKKSWEAVPRQQEPEAAEERDAVLVG